MAGAFSAIFVLGGKVRDDGCCCAKQAVSVMATLAVAEISQTPGENEGAVNPSMMMMRSFSFC